VDFLKACRDSRPPLRFRDPLGQWCEVYVTDVVITLEAEPVATIVLMVTSSDGASFPASGINYTAGPPED
jgi:hypothetical protein